MMLIKEKRSPSQDNDAHDADVKKKNSGQVHSIKTHEPVLLYK